MMIALIDVYNITGIECINVHAIVTDEIDLEEQFVGDIAINAIPGVALRCDQLSGRQSGSMIARNPGSKCFSCRS